ncbi:TPA: hypothetical protein I9063_003250 [Clostridium perfringens]|uniref:Uncharacterized protein n=1 Tax=Clostridium perfringens TaxID=1502 RepID=A0AAN5SGA8_CLOPF|nr:hypothetical protein [Clostridium perfringens]MDK0897119.1 hypothetical protein [Clostridium perfringens]PWX45442.1 hypothetical protein CYK72_15430 [Clostridium perfringens]HAT4299826.1 hypothetical protein [Clostridium perfringens]HAT4304229.1 hypothetical protein [Clostridium perfringens]HAT4324677.1 hypothetical protein [Clostridium perfringens]
MSNLEIGLNNNIAFLESILSKENKSKRDLLNIYGDLKVLEYRAFFEKESDLFYRIQKVIVELEEFILE